ncbi:MAG: helix-turn-helix domain-containing protein [Anaerolineae bacterium]|nr:helix-turn-helix domain-containing protein [Anaerolineae bacterium]
MESNTSNNRARDFDVNETFREMLSKTGWSQSEAARRLHVSSNHVNQIVRDRGVPSPLLMAFFEKLLDEMEKPDAAMKALAEKLSTMSPSQREQAIRTIRTIVESFRSSKGTS